MSKFKYKRYIPSFEVQEVHTKDGKIFKNHNNHNEGLPILSGLYVSDSVVHSDIAENQTSLFKKGGELSNMTYIKRRDIEEVIVGDEDDSPEYLETIKGTHIYNGIWLDDSHVKALMEDAKEQGRFKKKSDYTTSVEQYPVGYTIRVSFGKENRLMNGDYEKKEEAIAFAKRLAGKNNGEYKGFLDMRIPTNSKESKFIAKYNGKTKEIQAETLYDAKKKAILQFMIPKSKQGLLSVMSEKSIEQGDFRFLEKGGEIKTLDLFDIKSLSSKNVKVLTDKNNEIYFLEDGVLYNTEHDEMGNLKRTTSYRMSKYKLNILNFTDIKYAKGGEIKFVDKDSNPKGGGVYSFQSKKGSIGAFAHKYKGKYVGDYYLYPLDGWDIDYYHDLIKTLKTGERLFRVQTDRSEVHGWKTLIKINILNGRIYFIDEDSAERDDKIPKFQKSSVDVVYLTMDEQYKKGYVIEDDKDVSYSIFYRNGGELGRDIKIVNKGVKFNKSKYKSIFGDFDKDGILNIDDANPLTKDKKGKVEQVELSKTFDALLQIKSDLDTVMNDTVAVMDKKVPKNADIYARTKTPYSILKKLVDKRLLDPKKGLTDLVGTTIAVDNYDDLISVRNKIRKGTLGEVLEEEDFYTNPKGGYMAYHFIINVKDIPVEVQLKTKRMKKLNEISHEFYKDGTLNGKEFLVITKLFYKADKGDIEALKEVKRLLANTEELKIKIKK